MDEIIEIRSGDYRARINCSRGANCVSLRNTRLGARILREPVSQEPDNPYLYGMPILFPVNRISGGSFQFEGRTYRFPVSEQNTGCHLHGFLHGMPFQVTERTDHSVTCVFDEPYMDFPHRFRIAITYQLSECGLEQRTRITNLSETNMPVLLGFHTTFNTQFLGTAKKEDIRVFAEVLQEIQRNMETYLPTGVILPPDMITEQFQNGTYTPVGTGISRHYRAGGMGRMDLVDRESGIRLVYENSQNFPWRLVYSDGKEYICLEPMTCMVNAPNAPFDSKDTGFAYIKPYQTEEYNSKIYLQEDCV